MGMIGSIIGAGKAAGRIGDTVGNVAEVFVGNQAERDEQSYRRHAAALKQFGSEFDRVPAGAFDSFVDGLNRLPRPMLALGTIGMFVYAMSEPEGFTRRMEGLAFVPEPLWWILGAIVSFYFGARELHHQRARRTIGPVGVASSAGQAGNAPDASRNIAPQPVIGSLRSPAADAPVPAAPARVEVRAEDPNFNAAVEEWRLSRGSD